MRVGQAGLLPRLAVLAVVGWLAATQAHADPLYTAINLQSGVSGLNDSGQLVTSWDYGQPTVYSGYGVWAGETPPPISRPSDGFGYSNGGNESFINNAAQVATNAYNYYVQTGNTWTSVWHAVVSNGQTTTDLGTLGGTNSSVAGINDAGQVIGNADTSAGTSHAFIDTNGQMTDLGTLPGGQYSTALGINNSGQVVGYAQVNSSSQPVYGEQVITPGSPILGGGYHAVLFQQGQVIDLGTLGGANSVAAAINQSGQIVGTAETASGAQHAFLYQDGKMQDLGVLNSDWANSFWGIAYSQAHAINNAGVIVGESNSLAFLDQNGTMYNLNSLVNLPGITLTSAWAINNVGQILATGVSSSDPYQGQTEYLLNPINLPEPVYPLPAPEPSTLLVMGALAGWFAIRQFSRRNRIAS